MLKRLESSEDAKESELFSLYRSSPCRQVGCFSRSQTAGNRPISHQQPKMRKAINASRNARSILGASRQMS